MKDLILKALKTKYKNLGFGEKAFEGVADYLAKTVTEEANIETAIDGVEGILKVFQSEADKLRGENTTLKSQLEAAKKAETKPADSKKDGEGGNDGDDVPKWAKKIFEGFEGVQKKLEALETDKVTGSRRSQLDDKLKDAPEALKGVIAKNFGKMKFESDDEFSEYLADVSTQVDEFAKQMKIDGVSENGKSPAGTGGGADKKEATKEELAAVTGKILI